MRQYVALVNSIYEYRTQAEVAILDRYPQSSLTVFDVYSLVSATSFLTFQFIIFLFIQIAADIAFIFVH